ADRLGLEEAIAGSPGWSESGGPWVKPNQGMKKVVWSETRVEGGKPFTGVLPHPPTVSGPFQNVPLFDFLALISGQTPEAAPVFYADSAVVAYRAPESDVPVSALRPTITSSGGNLDLSVLTDGDLVKTTALPKAPAGQFAHHAVRRGESIWRFQRREAWPKLSDLGACPASRRSGEPLRGEGRLRQPTQLRFVFHPSRRGSRCHSEKRHRRSNFQTA